VWARGHSTTGAAAKHGSGHARGEPASRLRRSPLGRPARGAYSDPPYTPSICNPPPGAPPSPGGGVMTRRQRQQREAEAAASAPPLPGGRQQQQQQAGPSPADLVLGVRGGGGNAVAAAVALAAAVQQALTQRGAAAPHHDPEAVAWKVGGRRRWGVGRCRASRCLSSARAPDCYRLGLLLGAHNFLRVLAPPAVNTAQRQATLAPPARTHSGLKPAQPQPAGVRLDVARPRPGAGLHPLPPGPDTRYYAPDWLGRRRARGAVAGHDAVGAAGGGAGRVRGGAAAGEGVARPAGAAARGKCQIP
jgi:hypothetical protein